MTDRNRRLLGNVLLTVAFLLLAVAVYGMLQTPRPNWTRVSPMVALIFILAASRLRRGTPASGAGDRVP